MELGDILIVVDMQNDFVTGVLGSNEAEAIVPTIVKKVKAYKEANLPIVFTKDTHSKVVYNKSLEGQSIPEHCIYGEPGWRIVPELKEYAEYEIKKSSFGTIEWNNWIKRDWKVEIVGVCTDICVITNALIIKTMFPNNQIYVDAAACAGSTPEAHAAALEVMKSNLIKVI